MGTTLPGACIRDLLLNTAVTRDAKGMDKAQGYIRHLQRALSYFQDMLTEKCIKIKPTGCG